MSIWSWITNLEMNSEESCLFWTFLSHQAFQKTDLFSLFTSPLFNKMNSRFEYVIAWGRGQLRINFTSIFKVFKKLPESRSIWKTLKIKVKLQRTTFKVLPSRKQVCRLSLFNRLAVAQGKHIIIVSKTQQVQFSQNNFFANKTLSNIILFTCFAKLTTAWNYFIDR